jgi:Protein of unknown function (DUF2950)
MRHLVRNTTSLAAPLLVAAAAAALLSSLGACSQQTPQSTAAVQKPAVEKPAQRTFATPEEAGAALLAAAKSQDQQELLAIFGPDAREVVYSGDPVKDKGGMQDFVAAYDQMHRWHEIKAGGEMLIIGADNFKFPIPLAKNSSGQWLFDTAAGKDEILARRIGRDELTTIAALGAIASAEQEYFRQARGGDRVRQYAQKLVSDEGQQNGLYWPVAAGQPASPLEGVAEFAKAAGYSNAGASPQPFNGYYYRILTRQGQQAKGGALDYVVSGKMTRGFAVLAWPAKYRDSGIMTFMVGRDGVVYQKDLGEDTATAAQALTEYNPAEGWKPAI